MQISGENVSCGNITVRRVDEYCVQIIARGINAKGQPTECKIVLTNDELAVINRAS